MQGEQDIQACTTVCQPQLCVATIGFFDGVHRGHRYLIQQVKDEALRLGLRSMLVTFPTHPARVLRPDVPLQLLTTPREKAQLLGETGVDEVAMLPFTPELAALSARQFMEKVLLKQFHVRVLVIGYDHRFGHDRTEGFGDYVRIGRDIGIDVVQARELQGLGHVSSSSIRRALAEGRVEDATTMLGRPYTLGGTVVSGHHVGTALGFPTANLRPDDPDKLIPMNGVYAVRTEQGAGMLNIGTRPTLDNGSDRSIEVHLVDFAGDLYGQHLHLHFLRFVRNEKKFDTVAELQEQLQADKDFCQDN